MRRPYRLQFRSGPTGQWTTYGTFSTLDAAHDAYIKEASTGYWGVHNWRIEDRDTHAVHLLRG